MTTLADGCIEVDRCRGCHHEFHYSWKGWRTRVIVGLPRTTDYKAVSYLWGDTKPLQLHCRKCRHVTTIPMESGDKFRRLMALTDAPGQCLWLDSLSIDQTNPQEIARIMKRMGEIYSKAQSVAILLPRSDVEAYKVLERMGDLASYINSNQRIFDSAEENQQTRLLGQYARELMALLATFEDRLPEWKYWKRAWTFQEWALATELSISCEGLPQVNLSGIKYPILKAVTTCVVYKLLLNQYAIVDVGLTRASGPAKYRSLHRLFPDEHAFIPPDAIEESKVNWEGFIPSAGFSQLLGLREAVRGNNVPCYLAFNLDADLPQSEEQRRLERFSMTMHARGVTERAARFEADLVASWASMCNIQYSYDKNDPFATALSKVLYALRNKHGFRIYNFLSNTTAASGEVDLEFLQYATAHRHTENGRYLHGLPVLTGRADAATHLRRALSRSNQPATLEGSGSYLHIVQNCQISQAIGFERTSSAMKVILPDRPHISRAVIGTSTKDLEHLLADPPGQAQNKWLLPVTLRMRVRAKPTEIVAWTVCKKNLDLEQCIVARESLNGTLVVASRQGSHYHIESYIVVTDNTSIVHLVKMDANGQIDLRVAGAAGVVDEGWVGQAELDHRRFDVF